MTPLVPDAVIERIVATCAPRRAILFGSRARGDARPDSDMDLLVVLDDDAPPAAREGHDFSKLNWLFGPDSPIPRDLASDLARLTSWGESGRYPNREKEVPPPDAPAVARAMPLLDHLEALVAEALAKAG